MAPILTRLLGTTATQVIKNIYIVHVSWILIGEWCHCLVQFYRVVYERANRPNNIMEGVGGVGEKCEHHQTDLSSAKVSR